MTVALETPIASSVANGATTVFPHAFSVLSASDLVVKGTLAGVTKVFALGVDYTVSGVGLSSGSVTFLAAPANGMVILRYRDSVLQRLTDYQNNGDLLAQTINIDIDRLWLVLQEIFNGSKGPPSSLRVPSGESIPTLPAAADRANRIAAFDSLGNPIVIPGVDASSAASLALDLANSVTAAKGAGLVAYNSALTYPANTVGAALGGNLLSLKSIGGVGDGVTANLTAINNALANNGRQKVFATPGLYLVSANPTNPYGVEFEGPGAVVKNITGGQQQLNSYADLHKYVIGKEYMHRVYKRLVSGYTGPVLGVGIKTFIFGDSTIQGTNVSTPFLVQNLLPSLCKQKGLRVPMNVVNRGVSGTKITDMSALGDLSVDTDLYIIKYGINDGINNDATRLATFATSLRSQLAAIRAAAFGSVDTLSIILMGPNSTSDTPQGRDERWYEQLRGVYIQAARDYNCVFFDTYAWLKDSRPAAGLWMDNPYGDGRAIHPGDYMTSWIWGGLFQAVFNSDETAPWRVNHLVNTSGNWDAPIASALPNNYDLGVSLRRATIANGWPIDGLVATFNQLDNGVLQFLWSFKPGNCVVAKRLSDSVGNAWNPWSGVPAAIPLSNGWVTYGAPYGAPSAVVSDAGIVTVNMIVKSGTTTLGTIIGTLPVGMRPASYQGPFPAVISTNLPGASVRINSTGTIELNSAGDATYTAITCSFPVGQLA